MRHEYLSRLIDLGVFSVEEVVEIMRPGSVLDAVQCTAVCRKCGQGTEKPLRWFTTHETCPCGGLFDDQLFKDVFVRSLLGDATLTEGFRLVTGVTARDGTEN